MNVLFLGYGRMGSSIGKAWLSAGLVKKISAVDPGLDKDETVLVYKSVSEIPAQSFDLIVVAVKPAYACTVLESLPEIFCKGAFVISVAAGIQTDKLSMAIQARCPIVRAMPNTPVVLGAGCTVLFTNQKTNESFTMLATQLFSAVGAASWLDQESLMDAVTALCGSGPAYYHLFTESLAQAGVELGLTAEVATALAIQTAYGAAVLQTQPGVDLVSLRHAVTSPNGTTAAAINVFESNHSLRDLVTAAARAAHIRSREMSES